VQRPFEPAQFESRVIGVQNWWPVKFWASVLSCRCRSGASVAGTGAPGMSFNSDAESFSRHQYAPARLARSLLPDVLHTA